MTGSPMIRECVEHPFLRASMNRRRAPLHWGGDTSLLQRWITGSLWYYSPPPNPLAHASWSPRASWSFKATLNVVQANAVLSRPQYRWCRRRFFYLIDGTEMTLRSKSAYLDFAASSIRSNN